MEAIISTHDVICIHPPASIDWDAATVATTHKVPKETDSIRYIKMSNTTAQSIHKRGKVPATKNAS